MGLCFVTPVWAASWSVSELGTLGGATSSAVDVSDTGVVVGVSLDGSAEQHAFVWTSSGGMVDLEWVLDPADPAIAISNDGTVIVGGSNYSAVYWTASTGTVDIGTLGGSEAEAYDVSADGTVIVGYSDTTGDMATHAFSWTSVGGMVDLGTLGGSFSIAYAVSADGSIIVGDSNIAGDATYHAFMWTSAGGMVDLGTLGGTMSSALDISDDGTTIVGHAFEVADVYAQAFVWTSGSGMVDIGTLGLGSSAMAVSADGSVVVGSYYTAPELSSLRAFRWTDASGMEDFNTILSDAGVDMTNIVLNYANGVSSDGSYIVGAGTFSGTSDIAYVAYYGDGTGAITTAAQQQQSVQDLSDHQQEMMIESRATAGQLLGFTRSLDQENYVYTGAMFGSAVAYSGGQYYNKDVTFLGGIAYGAQDYKDIEQEAAMTAAMAVRYSFEDIVSVTPYVELGGWVTPEADLKMARHYNGGTGYGQTETLSFAHYVRGGVSWDLLDAGKLTGYGELGQQYVDFDGYTEASDSSNPFPIALKDGLARLDIARLGGVWTYHIKDLNVPVSVTLSGAAAHAFNGRTGMAADTISFGSVGATFKASTWGEFSASVESMLMQNLSLQLNVNGTSGGTGVGTSLHGGMGLTYRF